MKRIFTQQIEDNLQMLNVFFYWPKKRKNVIQIHNYKLI